MSTPIPIITTQTVNTKQGVPFAYSLSGQNISNTTKFSAYNSNFPVIINTVKTTGRNPRLTFTPIVYGSGSTADIGGGFIPNTFIPNTIKIRAWNSTGVNIFGTPLDQAEGTIYVNTLPQKPVISPSQLVTARDEEQMNPYFIKGKNIPGAIAFQGQTFPETQWTSTRLPSGLSFNQGGYITGTPTQIGSFTAKFTANNPAGTSAPVTVSIKILPQPPKIEINGFLYSANSFFKPSIPIIATQNQSISSLQLKSVSKVPVTWTSNNLPKGILLSTNGLLSGKPTVYPPNGRITATATAKNSGGSFSMSIYFQIKPAPVILSTDFTITEETAFNFKILATLSPTSYDAKLILNGVVNPLPTWVVFNQKTGTFTGTPPLLSSGLYTLRVTVTTSQGVSSSKNIPVTIRPIELSLGAGTFTGAIGVAGIVEIVANLSAISVNLDHNTNRTTAFSPNLSSTGSTLFTLRRGYFIQGNPVTQCPPGTGSIVNPGKMIYHAYKNTGFGTYNPSERKGILIVPGKTYRQLNFSQGLYNIIASWIPNRCSRAAGFKVTYSRPLTMWVN